MQISSRFTEYGLTGGFFWICQFIFLWYIGQIQSWWSNLSTVQIPTGISQISSGAVTGLVSALGIIAIFVAGLLLDLLAAYFKPLEMRVFYRHLVSNRDWLSRLIADHNGYCGTDYAKFERRYSGSSYFKDTLAGLNIFLYWNRERRQRYHAVWRRGWGWRLRRPYERLWNFLASYVIVASGSSQLSLMLDQYYLWRAGRAISIVLLIVFFEFQYLTELPPLVRVVFPLGITSLAMLITLGTYFRLCFTLFALVYVTQEQEVKNGARPM